VIVFHPPQDSHRPAHLDEVVPQDWQTKEEVERAMIRSYHARQDANSKPSTKWTSH
jgi:hypothetical protein